MDTNTKLVMTFKAQGGKTINFTLDDPREDLNEEEVIATMNLIVEKNIFCPGDVDLVETVKARVVQTNSTEYDLK